MKIGAIIALGIAVMFIMTSGLASAADKGLELTTDKSAYNVGETVVITVTNSCDDGIMVPFGYIVVDADGNDVYHPLMLSLEELLVPGGEYTYTWDQTCDGGIPAQPGDYTVHTSWASVSFKIVDSSSSGKGGRSPILLPAPSSSYSLN